MCIHFTSLFTPIPYPLSLSLALFVCSFSINILQFFLDFSVFWYQFFRLFRLTGEKICSQKNCGHLTRGKRSLTLNNLHQNKNKNHNANNRVLIAFQQQQQLNIVCTSHHGCSWEHELSAGQAWTFIGRARTFALVMEMTIFTTNV